MNLNDFALNRGRRLEALIEADSGELVMNLRTRLHGRHGCIDARGALTAGMLSGSPMTLARHLLAAGHFCLRHLAAWQTSDRGRDHPQNQQTHDD
jgi:hypothetical protein